MPPLNIPDQVRLDDNLKIGENYQYVLHLVDDDGSPMDLAGLDFTWTVFNEPTPDTVSFVKNLLLGVNINFPLAGSITVRSVITDWENLTIGKHYHRLIVEDTIGSGQLLLDGQLSLDRGS